jgi:hypothetical protein
MSAEIAILQAEADALRQTIKDAARGLIERHPDLIIRMDAHFRTEPSADPNAGLGPREEIVGVTTAGTLIMRLSVDVGVTGR